VRRLTILLGCTLLAALGFATAVWPHDAKDLTLTCGGSSAQMFAFPSGTHLITIKVYRDGSLFKTASDTFTGQSGQVDVTFDATGTHDWKVIYSWTDDGGGMRSIEGHMSCGTTTTTTTTTTPCHCTSSTETVTNVQTVTVQAPPPPPVTVVETSPSVTVTVTGPSPPARTVTTTRTKLVPRTVVRTRTVVRRTTRWRTRIVHKDHVCKCQAGYRLWHGTCHPIAHGKG